MKMKIKRQSAVLVVFLLALFVASAFMLLSIQDGEFNPLAIVAGVVLVFFNVFFYTALRRVFKHLDRFALLAAQFLWSMGLVILFRMDQNIAIRQFLWLLVGSIALIIAMIFIRHTGDLGKWNWVLMGATLLLLLSSLVLGRSIGGARNWISLGGVSLQPSEFAKILFIIVSAYF
ncbi:MAG: FtsW/RodA/SpoVE family cell cycle protein, partial [bacterium]|nr:FtsW/RodA/SpoVE family cell cycle protein [bacterium]